MNAQPSSINANAQDSRIVQGLGLMVIAMLLAPLIDVFSKLATAHTSPAMITFGRFAFQGMFMLPIIVATGLWRDLSFRQSGNHAIRAAILVVSMICFVATLAVMPVADAVAIFFVEPIILTVLASIFLKETIGWRRYLACVVGFVGALIVIQPSFQELGFVTLLPIVTAFGVAVFALMTRALSQRENPWSMQFQMSIWALPIAAVAIFGGTLAGIDAMTFHAPTMTTVALMAGVGMAGAISGILSVFAYRAAPASVLAPMQYLEIVSATLLGWMVFSDFPNPTKWLGIAIIIGSGLFIIWRERRHASRPVTEAEKHTIAVEP